LERLFYHILLIPHSQHQVSPLGAVDCDLADHFVKALAEEHFAYWADTRVTGFIGSKTLIQFFHKVDNIVGGGRCR
jgi:hypothetical protein